MIAPFSRLMIGDAFQFAVGGDQPTMIVWEKTGSRTYADIENPELPSYEVSYPHQLVDVLRPEGEHHGLGSPPRLHSATISNPRYRMNPSDAATQVHGPSNEVSALARRRGWTRLRAMGFLDGKRDAALGFRPEISTSEAGEYADGYRQGFHNTAVRDPRYDDNPVRHVDRRERHDPPNHSPFVEAQILMREYGAEGALSYANKKSRADYPRHYSDPFWESVARNIDYIAHQRPELRSDNPRSRRRP